jgi:hypothetical protein
VRRRGLEVRRGRDGGGITPELRDGGLQQRTMPIFSLPHVLEIVPARAGREAAIGVILREQGVIQARARPLER